jgi:hypothetical protein
MASISFSHFNCNFESIGYIMKTNYFSRFYLHRWGKKVLIFIILLCINNCLDFFLSYLSALSSGSSWFSHALRSYLLFYHESYLLCAHDTNNLLKILNQVFFVKKIVELWYLYANLLFSLMERANGGVCSTWSRKFVPFDVCIMAIMIYINGMYSYCCRGPNIPWLHFRHKVDSFLRYNSRYLLVFNHFYPMLIIFLQVILVWDMWLLGFKKFILSKAEFYY